MSNIFNAIKLSKQYKQTHITEVAAQTPQQMQQQLKQLQQQQYNLEAVVNQVRQTTKAIKYDDTINSIIVGVRQLAEKTGIGENELRYTENQVLETFNQLQSEVYGLEEPFTDRLDDVKNKIEELEYQLENPDEELDEAGSWKQQAAIAINMQKHHKKPKSMGEGQLDEIIDPSTATAKALRYIGGKFATAFPWLAVGGVGAGLAASGLLAPLVASMGSVTSALSALSAEMAFSAGMAGTYAAPSIIQTIKDLFAADENSIQAGIKRWVEKYVGDENDVHEFMSVHSKAAYEGKTGFRWRAKEWPVKMTKEQAEAYLEKNEKSWLDYEKQKAADAEKAKADKDKEVTENQQRAVDAKGRTQQQWIQAVKKKFPDAKITQAKMIDGPMQATLPDGRKLSWSKVEQNVTESVDYKDDAEELKRQGNMVGYHKTMVRYYDALADNAEHRGDAKRYEALANKHHAASKNVAEGWSQKYKNSINCSHPKGFSQKAHCAGKKKHNESVEMEMTCPDCGMCQTHGDHSKDNLDEACWKGYHKEGNKKMFGKTYPNCVKNEGVAEGSTETPQQQQVRAAISKGMAKWDQSDLATYKSQPTNLQHWDPSGWASGQLKGINSIDPDGTVVIELDDTTTAGLVKKLATLGGMPGVKTRQLKMTFDPSKANAAGVTQGIVAEEKCPHCGGVMVSEELMNEKKDACYYKVKSRYKVWPSAYASGALVKCRKKGADNWGNGGKKNESSILEGIDRADESLHDWFTKEKWVRMDTKGNIKGPCAKEPGEGKPKCLPQSKAHSLGKKGRASAAQRKRREDPNPDRSGAAINVNTKKK
jgi:predicted transcriptional regulator